LRDIKSIYVLKIYLNVYLNVYLNFYYFMIMNNENKFYLVIILQIVIIALIGILWFKVDAIEKIDRDKPIKVEMLKKPRVTGF